MFTGVIMRKTVVALLGAFAMLQGSLVPAQGYPERPVKIIVPFAPGGIADGSARVIANHLSETWGKPFLVENRPGAATSSHSPRDQGAGRRLHAVYANTNIATNPSMHANLPYDAERDLVPVALGVITPGVIVVHPSSQARTLAELIAMAKEKPDLLTYSSVGVGSFKHLAMEQFQQV
jgi:tripartite-type tricarboxylate transporter receptor subunit TctC